MSRNVTLLRLVVAPALALTVAGCSNDAPTSPTDPDTPEFRRANRDYVQIDRFGIPAIATVFIPSSLKDAYNTAEPANDRATYGVNIDNVLTGFGVPNPALKTVVLPDIQPFNTRSSAGFLNGRRLSDDVITAELGIIFGSIAALNDDHVDANDKPFLPSFPYLAAPHQ